MLALVLGMATLTEIAVRKATERLGQPYEVVTPMGILYRETLDQARKTAEAQATAHGLPVRYL